MTTDIGRSARVLSSINGISGVNYIPGIDLKTQPTYSRTRIGSSLDSKTTNNGASDVIGEINDFFTFASPEIHRLTSGLPSIYQTPKTKTSPEKIVNSHNLYSNAVNTFEQQQSKMEQEKKEQELIKEREEAEKLRTQIMTLIDSPANKDGNLGLTAPSPDTSLEKLRSLYTSYSDKIKLENWIIDKKTQLMIAFVCLQFVGTSMGLPMDGFLFHQCRYMSKYHMFLVELGSKVVSSGDYKASSFLEGWPVEVRMMSMVGFNMTMYVILHYVSKRSGLNFEKMNSMLDNFLGQTPEKLEQKDNLRQAENIKTGEDIPIPNHANGSVPNNSYSSIASLLADGNIMNMITSLFGGGNSAGDDEPPVTGPRPTRPRYRDRRANTNM